MASRVLVRARGTAHSRPLGVLRWVGPPSPLRRWRAQSPHPRRRSFPLDITAGPCSASAWSRCGTGLSTPSAVGGDANGQSLHVLTTTRNPATANTAADVITMNASCLAPLFIGRRESRVRCPGRTTDIRERLRSLGMVRRWQLPYWALRLQLCEERDVPGGVLGGPAEQSSGECERRMRRRQASRLVGFGGRRIRGRACCGGALLTAHGVVLAAKGRSCRPHERLAGSPSSIGCARALNIVRSGEIDTGVWSWRLHPSMDVGGGGFGAAWRMGVVGMTGDPLVVEVPVAAGTRLVGSTGTVTFLSAEFERSMLWERALSTFDSVVARPGPVIDEGWLIVGYVRSNRWRPAALWPRSHGRRMRSPRRWMCDGRWRTRCPAWGCAWCTAVKQSCVTDTTTWVTR